MNNRFAIALVSIVVVPLASASAHRAASELRRDVAEAPSGRDGGTQPPQPPAPGRGGGRGGGPRGAEPLVIDDQAGFQPIFDGTSLDGWATSALRSMRSWSSMSGVSGRH
jgi:hypothetical protein